LYRANGWSSAEKPDLLHKALINSETSVSAWHDLKNRYQSFQAEGRAVRFYERMGFVRAGKDRADVDLRGRRSLTCATRELRLLAAGDGNLGFTHLQEESFEKLTDGKALTDFEIPRQFNRLADLLS
jgi:hypothetical protein